MSSAVYQAPAPADMPWQYRTMTKLHLTPTHQTSYYEYSNTDSPHSTSSSHPSPTPPHPSPNPRPPAPTSPPPTPAFPKGVRYNGAASSKNKENAISRGCRVWGATGVCLPTQGRKATPARLTHTKGHASLAIRGSNHRPFSVRLPQLTGRGREGDPSASCAGVPTQATHQYSLSSICRARKQPSP